MKTEIILKLFLLLLPVSALASSAQTLSLNARSNSKPVWTLVLRFSEKDSCKVEGNSSRSQAKKIQSIDASECKTLKKDFLALKTEIPHHAANPQKLRPSPVKGAFEYQFETGGMKFDERVVDPTACEVDSEGKANCTQNDLTGSQRLLLRLLDYARTMGLGASSKE